VLSLFIQQTFAGTELSKKEIAAKERAERRVLTDEELRIAREEQAGKFRHVYNSTSQSAVVYTRRPGTPIRDNVTNYDTLVTPALTNLNYVSIRLDTVYHTFVGDIIMRLTGPNGANVRFLGRRGGSGDHFIGTAFTDFAGRPISAVVAADSPFTGFFRPDAPLGVFQVASMPAGNWILAVTDSAGADTGRVVQWSLIVEPNEIVPPYIVHTKVRDSSLTAGRVASAVITDTSGVATGTGAPRLWWKLRTATTYAALVADSVNATTKTYWWTIPGQAAGTIVDYYIGAQDLAVTNNTGTFPFGGSGINPPGSTPPPRVLSYIVAQPLAAGTYTVGLTAGSTFPTLDSAFNRIRLNGIAGAVTFNLNDTIYNAPDRPIIGGAVSAPDILFEGGVQRKAQYDNADTVGQITLQGPIYGAGPSSRITIRPATSRRVVINGRGPSVLRLLDASWVTIDGITNTATGTTTLTIQDTATGSAAILLEGNSDNNIVTRVQIRMPQNKSTVGIFLTNGANGSPDNNRIGGTGLTTGNVIYSATDGILIIGSATAFPDRNTVPFNTIGSATDSLGELGIYNQQATNTQINGNIIQNVRALTGFNCAGIWVATKHLNTRIWNNVIKNVKVGAGQTAALFASGLYIFGTSTDITSGDYYNNAIYDLDNLSSSATATVRGVYASTGQQDTIAYNSVWLTGTAATAKQSSALWSLTHTGQVWRNNIAVNNRVETGTGFGLAFYKASTTSTLTSNNNDLYVPSNPNSFIGRVGTTNYATLTDWRTQTYDLASVSHNQAFRTGTDLRIDTLQATPVNNIGVPIPGITTDIDGQVRSTTTPDPGVDEFNAPAFNVHDIGVATLSRTSAQDLPSGELINKDITIDPADGVAARALDISSDGKEFTFFSSPGAVVNFRAVVQNYGSFPETTYQVRLTINGNTTQTVSNSRILAPGGRDTFALAWTSETPGNHVGRAFTLLTTDANRSNDTATVNFTVNPPSTDAGVWTSLAPSPNALSRSCVAYVKIADTGFVYQFGGGAGAQLTSVARYNTRTNTWTNTGFAPIPSGISAGTAIAVRDSNIYVFGHEGSVTVGRTYRYNVYTNTWTTLATMLKGITDAAVVKYRDTLFYVIGGGAGTFAANTTDTVQVYNSRTNSYSLATFYPIKASMMGTGIFKDTIVVAGGWIGATGTPNAYKGIINPSNPLQIAWSAIAPYPLGGVTRMASAYVTKGGGAGVLFAGGAINGATLTAKAYLWNFCTSSWSVLDTFATPRSNMKATGPGDSTAYVIAGFTTTGVGTSDKITFTNIQGNCNVQAVEGWADHVTSAMRVSVTNEGNVGSLNAFVGTGPGNGFQFNPVTSAGQRLFEGAFMLGLDSVRVSDAARNNASPEAFDADFQFLSNLDSSASSGIRRTITTSYSDALAETPFGARINQRTVSWDSAGLSNFLLVELDVTNTSATPWTTLHVGGFFDWDVNPANAQDRGSVIVDSTNTIPGVNNGQPFPIEVLELHQGVSPTAWMGVVPLHENRFRGRRIGISSTEVYPPRMTNGDKWRYMTSNRATNPNGDGNANVDHVQVFGSGPYAVPAGVTKRVGYGLFGGTSFANAVAAARAAQRAWVQRLGNILGLTTSVKDPVAGIPEVFALDQNYPNPFNPTTTIRYSLPEAASVNLSIYNVLGQRVATLTNEVLDAGVYNALWNGRNDAGAQVASGIYFYRIEAKATNSSATFTSLKKAMLLK
jgi:subtilisin-like proprotein convertase family protein